MADDIDSALAEWQAKIDKKADEIVLQADKAVLKAAFFCEGEAKKNVMNAVYSNSIPFDGEDMWERTGLLKASIGSGMNPDKEHSAIIYSSAPYAKYIEYGTGIYAVNGDGRQTPWIYTSNTGVKVWTKGMRAKPFMYPAVSNNKDKIREIIKNYLKEVMK